MIIEYLGQRPRLGAEVFIEQSARVIGDVELGAGSSVWFNAVVRGDVNYIRIGERTNIQDLCVVHVTLDKWPTFIGYGVTIGHRAVIHGARIGDQCLIGMGAIILDGAEIGDQSIIAAGTLIPPGMKVPPRSLVMGVPGKVARPVSDDDLTGIIKQGKEYERLAEEYREGKA